MTQTAQHTQGEWTLDQDNDDGVMVKDSFGNIVHYEKFPDMPNKKEDRFYQQIVQMHRSNARLIAAAPKLLKALDKIRHDFITLAHLNLNGDLSQRDMKNRSKDLIALFDAAIAAANRE